MTVNLNQSLNWDDYESRVTRACDTGQVRTPRQSYCEAPFRPRSICRTSPLGCGAGCGAAAAGSNLVQRGVRLWSWQWGSNRLTTAALAPRSHDGNWHWKRGCDVRLQRQG